MTVGQLKKMIENLDDNRRVYLENDYAYMYGKVYKAYVNNAGDLTLVVGEYQSTRLKHIN